MNAHEVVIHHVERDRVCVVLDLLREGIRQAGEAAHVHAHREIVPLHIRRADVVEIGLAFDRGLLDASAIGGAVAPLRALRSSAVDLHELRIVDVGPERALDGFKVRLVPVAGELDAVRKTRRDVVHEPLRALTITAADEVGDDELRVRIDRGPSPSVSRAIRGRLGVRNVLLLGVGEAPNLVDLDALRRHAPDVGVVIGHARLASIDQEFDDGVLAGAGQSRHGADRLPFTEKVENARTFM